MARKRDLISEARLRHIIREEWGGPGNAPYRIGRAPGFGWGTGQGGFNMVHAQRSNVSQQGGHPHKFGGSHLVQNPVQPYSDEFSDHMDEEREAEWKAAVRRFEQGMEQFKKELKVSNSCDQIEDMLFLLTGGQYDPTSDIVADPGMFHNAMKQGAVDQCKSMIAAGIDDWSKRAVARLERADMDWDKLDMLVYDPDGDIFLGKRSWS